MSIFNLVTCINAKTNPNTLGDLKYLKLSYIKRLLSLETACQTHLDLFFRLDVFRCIRIRIT